MDILDDMGVSKLTPKVNYSFKLLPYSTTRLKGLQNERSETAKLSGYHRNTGAEIK